MFYLARSISARPGRFENQFWSTHNPGTGAGWTNAKSYADTFNNSADAKAALDTLAKARKMDGDKAYITQIISSL